VPRTVQAHELASYWQLGDVLLGEVPRARAHRTRRLRPHTLRPRRCATALGLRPGYLVICPFAGGTFEKLDKSWPHFARFAAGPSPHWGETC
jgi:heptosyltransferase-2